MGNVFMGNVFSKWRDIIDSESLEEYLAEHFGDKTKFRFSTSRWHPTKHRQRHWVGTMRAAKCFVLQGRFRISFVNVQFDVIEQFELTEGDYCELPEGRYKFEIIDDSECAWVKVFTIPDVHSDEWKRATGHRSVT
jgi:hypothetical protein